MATLFHPPTTLLPMKQDENSNGKPSDHNVVIAAPKTDVNFKLERHKIKLQIRPQPESRKSAFMREFGTHSWPEVNTVQDPHDKAQNFHETLIHTLDKYFPVKNVKMTSLDKPWFNPALKIKYNQMQSEFFTFGKSLKWKQLRRKFRIGKKAAVQDFYQSFVYDLKKTHPSQYYKMARKIGAFGQKTQGKLVIECLEGQEPQAQVQKVAEHFSKISNEYDPVDLSQLPAYLPAEKAPQIEVYNVYRRTQSQKRTKSTFPIDLPEALRKEAAEFLAEPLTNIFNSCLQEGIYPRI